MTGSRLKGKPDWKQRRYDAGNCVRCNRSRNDRKQRTCAECAKANSEYLKQRAADRKDAGICMDCDARAEAGITRCRPCADKTTDRLERLRTDRNRRGLCAKCEQVKLPDAVYCEDHYFRKTAHASLGSSRLWSGLKDLWRRQKGKCAYTGSPIVLGLDAELDHVIAKARGGPSTLDNVVWASRRFNWLKRDLTPAELRDQCYAFVQRAEQGLTPVGKCEVTAVPTVMRKG